MSLNRNMLVRKTAGGVAGMLPVVGEQMKVAVELASTICELVKTVRRNREDWVALAEHAALTTSTMKEELEEGEAISSVACEKAATQLMSVLYEIKDSIPDDRSLAAQTLHVTGDKEKIDGLRLKLADSMGRFGVAAQMHMIKTRSVEVTTPVSPSFFVPPPIEPATKVRYRVPFLGEDAILESLAPVDEARFDHETSADSCLQGTREAMLKTIFEWIDSLAPGPLIFWLAGLAGTGKTTIATTVCEELNARESRASASPGQPHPPIPLGADFFMSRHSAPRQNPHSIVCTIAYQLADRFPSVRPFLVSALRLNPRVVTSKNMEGKIMELIIGPLESAIRALPSCIVIVLDALDECDGHGAEFLPLFARLTSKFDGVGRRVRVKLVITSRLEGDIRSMFSTIGHASFRLHDIEQHILQADIQRYLHHSFRQITLKNAHVFPTDVEWPSSQDISTLVSRSGALFIYAATVVKFVDVAGHSPERRLETLIKSFGKTPTVVGLPMLDSLYMEVLQIAVTDAHSHGVDEALAQRMQQVAGAVILLQVPVSIQTLSSILDIHPKDVQFALDGMASMLLIPPSDSSDPIRIFHPSFPDFLLDPKRCSDPRFGVQAGMIHSQLARRCLAIMNTYLHYDMCDFRDPSLKNADVKDLSERIDRYVPPELVYACIFWKAHLDLTTDDNTAPMEMMRSFILMKMLPWIESLSVLSSISVALPALDVAQVWCIRRSMNDEIERLKSVRHFVLYDSEVADSALYIYQIASFHPAFNVQSNICLPSDLKVRLITAPSQEWSNQPGIFGRHRASVNCLAISPSRTKLASASEDTFVRIWDVEIGHCILEMAGHTASVLSVAFSPDGSQLVSAAEDGSIRVWDVQSRTGLTLVQFVGHSSAVNSVIYTVDGERVVSGSRDGTIRIWSIESGQEEVELNCVDPVLCLSISPDGTTLVSSSANGFVQLWDIATDEHTPIIVFRLGDKRLPTVVFLDASRIAIGCCKGEVRFWSTHDGLAEMRLHLSHYANSIAFSPDGSLVASGGGDGLIQISDASSGSLLGELDKHTMGVRSVVFSADSRRLFSASADGTIRVWSLFDGSLPTLAPPDIHEPSSSRRRSLTFLPRARRSLSDGFIPISAPPSVHESLSSSREERRNFHPKSVLSVAFSPDERWLVSTSGHSGVLVWDTKSGKCASQLGAFALHLTPFSFHPKSTSPTFACGSDKYVCLWAWDSETWKQTTKLQGHTGRVNCVQFSHDGLTLFSSSQDGTIKLWGSTSKTNIRTLSLPKSPEIFDGLNKFVSRLSKHRVHQMGDMPIHSIVPFPDATRIVMCSNGIVDIWDTDHHTPPLAPDGTRRAICSKGIWNTEENHHILAASIQRAMDLSGVIGMHTPYELRSPRNAELTCTPSEAGDAVYVAATAIDSRLLWDGNGELLDSNGPQWKYVRAKQYPNIVEESGWVLHTERGRLHPRKLAWIPADRRNISVGALATSQSGRLLAIGSHSGLITILDVSGMVEHLAGTETNVDVVDLSSPSPTMWNAEMTANDLTAGNSSESSSDTELDITSNEKDCAGVSETFVIYSRDDIKPERASRGPFTTNDLTSSQTSLSTRNISCSMSVHEPGDAVSWIEDNWDSDLLTSIRNSDCGGPLPWMLSPEEPSLTIFGCYRNPTVVAIAQSLAELSGFPIVIRPSGDNPALTLINDAAPRSAPADRTTSSEERSSDANDVVNQDENTPQEAGDSGGSAGGRPVGGGAGEQGQNGSAGGSDGGGSEYNGKDASAGRSDSGEDQGQNGNAGGSGGGGGGGGRGGDNGGGPTFMDDKWESPLHGTRAKLGLKINTAQTYTVNIGYTFKFTIQRKTEIPINLDDLNSPLSQPEVIALVDFQIETRPRETQVDRSYASIGFVVHRKKSIFQRKFLHRGFDLPDKRYTHGKNRLIQRGVKAALGFSAGSPLATTAFTYNQNRESTLEATDSKVMPRCHVAEEIGDEWDNDNESYSSYNMVYQAHVKPMEGEPEFYPLEVKVGMGINLRPSGSKAPHPQLSFVNRNQVFIWVSDPMSKARIRGIVVLMSSYLANIRSQEELTIYEQEDIDLSSGPSNAPTKNEHHEPGTISLAIAKAEIQDTRRSNKLRTAVSAFTTKVGHGCSTSAVTNIRPHECLARGWDATNSRWRSVLWPALDKDFGAADLESTPPVWMVQCPWKKGKGTSSSAGP